MTPAENLAAEAARLRERVSQLLTNARESERQAAVYRGEAAQFTVLVEKYESAALLVQDL